MNTTPVDPLPFPPPVGVLHSGRNQRWAVVDPSIDDCSTAASDRRNRAVDAIAAVDAAERRAKPFAGAVFGAEAPLSHLETLPRE